MTRCGDANFSEIYYVKPVRWRLEICILIGLGVLPTEKTENLSINRQKNRKKV